MMPNDPNLYHCPVYMTPQRGSTYLLIIFYSLNKYFFLEINLIWCRFVFTATLKTKLPPATWITAGTALLMDKPE